MPSRSQDQEKVIIRLPDGMRLKLKLQAMEHGRTMNAEIVARLEETFRREREGPKRPLTLTEIQNSPSIRLAKQLIAAEARFDRKIEELEQRLDAIEKISKV